MPSADNSMFECENQYSGSQKSNITYFQLLGLPLVQELREVLMW